MWIAVTGAQGSGKSTVVRALAERLEQLATPVVVVGGIGAYVGSMNFPLGEAATRDTISAFILEHIRRERHAPDMALFDRCLIDLVAYTILQLRDSDPLRLLAVELAQMSMSRFTHVFMATIPPERVNRSSPHESAQFRARFEHALLASAALCHTRLVTLRGTVDERVQAATDTMFKAASGTDPGE